ncbi:hypothetical protein [Dyadobacter aurulentus]|uniref:hypothetical protein n=1 Tax=Dyadobacter sp. UC 10 TaxID=2605428 RepID=UPI0011F275FE|nr:hypothetical protein [Dyadobacter sp. UC 10]KAA0992856.1 hypothetical protein FXO21_23130 [Dyadobacter sp. UC 10]
MSPTTSTTPHPDTAAGDNTRTGANVNTSRRFFMRFRIYFNVKASKRDFITVVCPLPLLVLSPTTSTTPHPGTAAGDNTRTGASLAHHDTTRLSFAIVGVVTNNQHDAASWHSCG